MTCGRHQSTAPVCLRACTHTKHIIFPRRCRRYRRAVAGTSESAHRFDSLPVHASSAIADTYTHTHACTRTHATRLYIRSIHRAACVHHTQFTHCHSRVEEARHNTQEQVECCWVVVLLAEIACNCKGVLHRVHTHIYIHICITLSVSESDHTTHVSFREKHARKLYTPHSLIAECTLDECM